MTTASQGRPIHRTSPAHGEQTKARLVSVARDMFAERGHAGVAMEDVCVRAEVTRGALYHHFPGKHGLFLAVCELVAADVSERIVAATRGQADAWTRLVAGCRAFLEVSTQDDVRQILLSDAPSVLGWTRLRELDARHGLGLLRLGIKNAMQDGSIEHGPVETLAAMLVSALNEAALLITRSPHPKKAHAEALQALDRLLAGIAGNRPTPHQ